jgi:hypothetical protein
MPGKLFNAGFPELERCDGISHLQELIKSFFEINKRNKAHPSITCRSSAVVQTLIAAGADVKVKNVGKAALFFWKGARILKSMIKKPKPHAQVFFTVCSEGGYA